MLEKKRTAGQWADHLAELAAAPERELTLAEYTAIEHLHACNVAQSYLRQLTIMASEFERLTIKYETLSGKFERMNLANAEIRAVNRALLRRLKETDPVMVSALNGVYRELGGTETSCSE